MNKNAEYQRFMITFILKVENEMLYDQFFSLTSLAFCRRVERISVGAKE
jgi:hypothetical protein